jgi:multidrug efflux system membrane fusion protein
MPRFHRIAAFCVLAAAAAWIATGEFSSVGSAQGSAEGAAPEPAAAEEKPVLRTVAAVTPTFVDYARTIRLSGVTVAD